MTTEHVTPQLELDYKPKLGAKTDYGIGIIGTGWVANNYHLPAYRKAGFSVVAITDINKEKVEATGRHWGIEKVFTDYHQLLELDEVQIVDIATPTFGRLEIVENAAAAGKHMLVQKPLARQYADALAMVEAAEKAGVKLGVNSHYRWLPNYRAAYNLLQQGLIGEPFLIIDEMHGNQDFVYYYQMPERRWNAELDDFMFVEWGAHHFDFVRFWAGKEPLTVYCVGTRKPGQIFKSEMVCLYVLRFPEPLRACLILDQVSPPWDFGMRFRIEGTEGVVEGWDYLHLRCYANKIGDEWAEWRLDVEEPLWSDSYIGTMGDLMNAITEGREHISSGRDNLNTVRAYLAGMLSAKEGRPVRPEEIR
ncbi:MAG: Gfo/Idh/MocA family protein [Thermodesulfobacteriota bacterium]